MGTYLLAGFIPATAALLFLGLRPGAPKDGDEESPTLTAATRLAVVRAAVVLAAYAVVTVETLSALGWLTRGGVLSAWLIALAGAAALVVVRARRGELSMPRRWWPPRVPRLGWSEWPLVLALAGVAAGTLLIAVLSPPNNWDSQAYHLPKIEQWVQAGSIGFFPTSFTPQVALPPGAEYLLLHLRLLTGGDRLYNFSQWSAWVLCMLACSRIAAQLGASRRGQLITALVFGAAPAVVLEATSTQTDLVTSAWSVATATLTLDLLKSRGRVRDFVLLGAAAGLAVATKPTGMVAAGVMVGLWLLNRLRGVRSAAAAGRLAATAVGIAACALLISGPFLTRMTIEYGNPLGPPEELVAHSIQDHNPAALTVNGARLAQTTALVPPGRVNVAESDLVTRLARLLHQDINNPDTTRGTYPLDWYAADEDIAPFPVQDAIIALSVIGCLIARRRTAPVPWYLLACALVAVGYAATVKWQPYGNRLVIPALAICAPLAGVGADVLVAAASKVRASSRGAWRRAARPAVRLAGWGVLAGALALVLAGGSDAILHGKPRSLTGPHSVRVTSQWGLRYSRMPALQGDYAWAADQIKASGAMHIGFVESQVWNYEYPWWVMLRGRHLEWVYSTVPGHPSSDVSTFDAIICFDKTPPQDCKGFIPHDWQVIGRPYVTLALRPGLSASPVG
jgi:hypothetical protein